MGASSVNLLQIFRTTLHKNTSVWLFLDNVNRQNEKNIFDTNHYVIRKDHKVFFCKPLYRYCALFCQIFIAVEKT